MSDKKQIIGGEDRRRINVHEDYEVRGWCKSFGVTPDVLKAAVATVGDRVDSVREYLGAATSE